MTLAVFSHVLVVHMPVVDLCPLLAHNPDSLEHHADHLGTLLLLHGHVDLPDYGLVQVLPRPLSGLVSDGDDEFVFVASETQETLNDIAVYYGVI